MTTNKPATPLPFRVSLETPSRGAYIKSGKDRLGTVKLEDDAAYIVAACNAFPQLVEDRARLVEALRESFSALDACLNSGDTASALNEADRVLTEYRPILRELGEL